MDAIEMLSQDHQHLRQLLRELVGSAQDNPLNRQGLLTRLSNDLAVHSRLEEEAFYPAVALAAGETGEGVRLQAKSLAQHRAVERQALPDLIAQASAPGFQGQAQAVKELIEHHLAEEEHELFPLARKVMSEGEFEELGSAMTKLRSGWFAQGWPSDPQARGPEVPAPQPAMRQVQDWLDVLSDRGQRAVSGFAKDPAHSIGKGVELAVGCGARLAGEIFGGVRRGLAQARDGAADKPSDRWP